MVFDGKIRYLIYTFIQNPFHSLCGGELSITCDPLLEKMPLGFNAASNVALKAPGSEFMRIDPDVGFMHS